MLSVYLEGHDEILLVLQVPEIAIVSTIDDDLIVTIGSLLGSLLGGSLPLSLLELGSPKKGHLTELGNVDKHLQESGAVLGLGLGNDAEVHGHELIDPLESK